MTQSQLISSGFPEKMVLLDCETTGGKATYHRITEIGLVIVEYGGIVESWQTMVNPEQAIPSNIQRLTGISPEMVANAPTFVEIADELREKLEGRTLVAHNARFDYGFLKNEFERAGKRYTTKPLCSVKLSRALYPTYKRHSLNHIILRFKISVENRHRALDDAQVILQFFRHATQQKNVQDIRSACQDQLKHSSLPSNLNPSEVAKLPKAPGVYFFYDEKGNLLYVGKSVNIHTRVMSHFNQDYRNNKDLQMSSLIAHIDYERTLSDFGAQLLESQRIKSLSPIKNQRLRKVSRLYQLQLKTDDLGYLNIHVNAIDNSLGDVHLSEQFGLFRSQRQAKKRVEKLTEFFFLCDKLSGLQSTEKANKRTPCFGYQLKRCLGACCQQETPEVYNERVQQALKEYRFKTWPWSSAILVEEKAADSHESLWHLVHEWRYMGVVDDHHTLLDHGFIVADESIRSQLDDPQPIPDSETLPVNFDLDNYLILIRFLLNEQLMQQNNLRVIPLARYIP